MRIKDNHEKIKMMSQEEIERTKIMYAAERKKVGELNKELENALGLL